MIPVEQIRAIVQDLTSNPADPLEKRNQISQQIFEDTEAYVAELLLAGSYQVSIENVQNFLEDLKRKVRESAAAEDKEDSEKREEQEKQKEAEDKIQELFNRIKKIDTKEKKNP